MPQKRVNQGKKQSKMRESGEKTTQKRVNQGKKHSKMRESGEKMRELGEIGSAYIQLPCGSYRIFGSAYMVSIFNLTIRRSIVCVCVYSITHNASNSKRFTERSNKIHLGAHC